MISIVVVNYNGGETLRECVESFRRTAPDAELLVVDNASSDGSVDDLAGATIIPLASNVGYAAAINEGVRRSRGDVLVFSNMDIIAEPGWLEPLVAFLDAHAEAGAINPLILLPDGQRVNAAGQDVHVTGLGFNRGLGKPTARFEGPPVEVSGVQGALIVMRRAVFDEIGGIDARGFLYHEDVNLSWLLRLAGRKLYCVPQSRVRHDYFLSMDPQKFHLLERNRVAMLLAYMRPSTRLVLLPLLLLTEALAWCYSVLRGWRFVMAKARSYAWVVAQREHIAERRALATRLRRTGDWSLLRRMRWQYTWGQFATLANERGESPRKRLHVTPIA